MEIHTLAFVNFLLFALYAGVMVVNSRILGGSKAAIWFAGSNLCRCLALLGIVLVDYLPQPYTSVCSDVLLVAGMMMLHRSFVEMLDRAGTLWRMHLVFLGMAIVGSVYLAHAQPAYPAATLLVSAILGVQTALTAAALFSFSGDGVKVAGWFTGVTLVLYALVYLMRAVVCLRYRSPLYPQAALEMEKTWMLGCLLSSAAAAFGFMFISAAKLRLELLWRAQIDELTGLLNRWAFKRVAVRESFRCMRTRGRLAVVSMDLDGMKGVNDRLGHGCGDAVLQAVSTVLQEALRERDSIARMGGDEFCILLPDTDMEEAIVVAERLRTEVNELRVRYRGEVVRIQASFGVSSSQRSGWNWQNLVDQSDAALYRAKRDGNKRVMAAEGSPAQGEMSAEMQAQVAMNERRKR